MTTAGASRVHRDALFSPRERGRAIRADQGAHNPSMGTRSTRVGYSRTRCSRSQRVLPHLHGTGVDLHLFSGGLTKSACDRRAKSACDRTARVRRTMDRRYLQHQIDANALSIIALRPERATRAAACCNTGRSSTCRRSRSWTSPARSHRSGSNNRMGRRQLLSEPRSVSCILRCFGPQS